MSTQPIQDDHEHGDLILDVPERYLDQNGELRELTPEEIGDMFVRGIEGNLAGIM